MTHAPRLIGLEDRPGLPRLKTPPVAIPAVAVEAR